MFRLKTKYVKWCCLENALFLVVPSPLVRYVMRKPPSQLTKLSIYSNNLDVHLDHISRTNCFPWNHKEPKTLHIHNIIKQLHDGLFLKKKVAMKIL